MLIPACLKRRSTTGKASGLGGIGIRFFRSAPVPRPGVLDLYWQCPDLADLILLGPQRSLASKLATPQSARAFHLTWLNVESRRVVSKRAPDLNCTGLRPLAPLDKAVEARAHELSWMATYIAAELYLIGLVRCC